MARARVRTATPGPPSGRDRGRVFEARGGLVAPDVARAAGRLGPARVALVRRRRRSASAVPSGSWLNAGLPGRRAIVCVGPPFQARGSSAGSAVGIVAPQAFPGNWRLYESSTKVPPWKAVQLVFELCATMVFPSLTVEPLATMAPAPVAAEFPAIVQHRRLAALLVKIPRPGRRRTPRDYLPNTTRPPTTVISTGAERIARGSLFARATMSAPKTTRSASLPRSSVPLRASMNSAKAEPRV